MTRGERAGSLLWSEIDVDGALAETEAALVAANTRARWTRAGVLRAGAGVVLGAFAVPGVARAASTPDSGDEKILNYALGLEYLQAAFYTEAERSGALKGATAEQAKVVGSHERAHVEALQNVLGSAAIKEPSFDFKGTTEDQDEFIRTGVAFEDLGTAAYKGQAPNIKSKSFLAALIAIHSVEARHAGWIRRLAGRLPADKAFDEPLSAKRVRAIVTDTGFITSPAKTSTSRSAPQFTG
jgi:rubrerythrin